MPPSVEELRAYLQGALPDSHLTEAPVAPSYNPLLLLHSNHVLAAFGFSNGDLRKSYESIYTSFKKYYTEQRGQWDALDLAFVFCVKPDIPQLDQFCSSVETDVYFCRKFVVPLSVPVGASLARLPFLPLTPLTGQSLRPPSAQTFLHQCGAPAVLAKYLVVQRARGPQTIVEDCINGDFGDPVELTPMGNSLISQPEHVADPISVESLTIKNFRAYRKPQTFTLGSDVTVLYGANGFGKTSFFDAFDFATTGEIGRLKSHGEEHFRKAAAHLDSKPEDSTVSLSFWSNGALRKLTRTVSDRKFAMLDGIRTDRKSLLSELTSGDFPATDRVENFVSLFRATHLFNQEQPELTRDFQDDCRLPSELVARMLAFEDYASAVSKATKVREHLDSIITEANTQIRQLSEQITEETSELSRLSRTTASAAPGGSLEQDLQALSKKLAEVDLFTEPEKADASVLRGWRASLESRLSDSHRRSDRLATLAKDVGDIGHTRSEISQLQGLIADKDRAFSEREAQRAATEPLLRRAEQQVGELGLGISAAQTRVDLLEWARLKRPIYDQLLHRERAILEALSQSSTVLTQDRVAEESIAEELRKYDELAARQSELLSTARGQLAALDRLSESVAAWRAKRARLKAVIELEGTAAKVLDALLNEARDLATLTTEVTAEEARITRSIAEVDKSQSELKRLASQLAGHVQTGTCPLCGEDHGSRDELLRRIQFHISVDVASGVRAILAEVRSRARHLSEQVAENMEKRQVNEAQIKDFRAERGQLDTDIRQFTESAEGLGVVLDAPGQPPSKQLQSLRNRVEQEIEQLEVQVKESTLSADVSRARLRDLRVNIAPRATEIAERTAILSRVRSDLAELRGDPRVSQVSLDGEDELFRGLERAADAEMAELRSKAEIARQEVTKRKSELTTINQESAALKTQLSELRGQLANLQRLDADVTARLKQEELPPDASHEMLLRKISEGSQLQAQLASLRDSVSNLELALDTATTSAALTQLRQNVRNKEKVVEAAARRRDQHQPWIKYFTDLSRLVSAKQSEAITSFTREYGPRTSVIQRRLRSVYGFDEVEIRSQNSEITVRVRRHGEELRPTDYFSQSQQQTLFLGLFLTACISQTWSAFSPVFLDDPVTHFDDLNTYAFLDLVVGLLEPSPLRRQFVISTCDDKLLQLARQKFRHLGDRAKFYRFSSISEDGPTAEEIPSS